MILPRTFIIPLLLIALLLASPLGAREMPACSPQETPEPAFAELVRQAEQAYANRQDLDNLKNCIELYSQALAIDDSDWQVNLKNAMAILWIEGYHTDTLHQNADILLQGINTARKAVEAQPDNILAHYTHGLLNGFYGKALNSLNSLSFFDVMEEELKWVLEHDPEFDYGGVYRAWGRYYAGLPFLLGGDEDKALEFYQQAKETCPQYLLNDILIAELYLGQDNIEEARALLRHVLASPQPEDSQLVPEWHMWQVRASRVMDTMPEVTESAAIATHMAPDALEAGRLISKSAQSIRLRDAHEAERPDNQRGATPREESSRPASQSPASSTRI